MRKNPFCSPKSSLILAELLYMRCILRVCLTHRCCVAADGWRVAVGVDQIAVSLCRRVERQAVIRDAVLSCVVLRG